MWKKNSPKNKDFSISYIFFGFRTCSHVFLQGIWSNQLIGKNNTCEDSINWFTNSILKPKKMLLTQNSMFCWTDMEFAPLVWQDKNTPENTKI